MSNQVPLVLFANADATTVDDEDQQVDAAVDALRVLEAEGVPLVLCSGRTRAEVEMLQRRLRISHPFVCEYGCAAFVPAGYFPFTIPDTRVVGGYQAVEFGMSYGDVTDRLQHVARKQA